MVLLSISSSSFGNYFGMADKLCTICLFFIISSRPNNEIIDECKSEDKNHKNFANNGYKQGCRENQPPLLSRKKQKERQMSTAENLL